MLVKKETNISPYREIVVPVKENNHSNKTVINLDDALIDCEDDEEMAFSEEYYNSDWSDTPAAEEDEKILTQQQFYNMPSGCQSYYLYRQLINISSLLSDIKEVLLDGNKE